MKKIIFAIAAIFVSLTLMAQNVQLHYDFGEDRQMFTTTLEMFKPDKIGSTFFFVDFDYGSKASEVNGVSSAYWEIAREFTFWEAPFALHAEFNAGMFRTKDFSSEINNAYLLGGAYNYANEDFSRTFGLQLLYKYIQDKHDAAFQITTVWGLHFFDRKISFTGFADFWREDNIVFDDQGNIYETDYVFLTEPQLWYNFAEKFSVGSEVEISTNFNANKGFMVNPTIALKWIF